MKQTKKIFKSIKQDHEIKHSNNLRVLVSVSRREGVVGFINGLKKLFALTIVATPGTADYLKKSGIEVIGVEKVTGFPATFSGRIKCIHFPIFAGVLADRQNPDHVAQLKKYSVDPFDMVIVNFYPFGQAIKEKKSFREVIELIDIGGPALIRAAAKNFQSVIPVCDPNDYSRILKVLKKNQDLSFQQRKTLAKKVFALMVKFDQTVIKYLSLVKDEKTL